jgi:hypothetical protein
MNYLIKKWAEDLNRYFTKIHKWPVNHEKALVVIVMDHPHSPFRMRSFSAVGKAANKQPSAEEP